MIRTMKIPFRERLETLILSIARNLDLFGILPSAADDILGVSDLEALASDSGILQADMSEAVSSVLRNSSVPEK